MPGQPINVTKMGETGSIGMLECPKKLNLPVHLIMTQKPLEFRLPEGDLLPIRAEHGLRAEKRLILSHLQVIRCGNRTRIVFQRVYGSVLYEIRNHFLTKFWREAEWNCDESGNRLGELIHHPKVAKLDHVE